MNPELPNNPREELELKITALLLGELEPAEAERVRQSVLDDPDLSRLHDQLKRTLGLVREASGDLAEETGPVRLSDEKRDALLAHFKTKRVAEPASMRSRAMPWYVPAGIAAVLIALIALVGLLPTTREFAAKRPFSVTPLPGLPYSESGQANELERVRSTADRLPTPELPLQAAFVTNHGVQVTQLADRREYSRLRRSGEVAGHDANAVDGSFRYVPQSGFNAVAADDKVAKVVLPLVENSDGRDYLDQNRNGRSAESSPGQMPGEPGWLGALNKPEETAQATDNRFVGRYATAVSEGGVNRQNKLDLNTIHSASQGQSDVSGRSDAFQVNRGAGSWKFGAATEDVGAEAPNAGWGGEVGPKGSGEKTGEQRSRERFVVASSQSGIVLPEEATPETVNLWSIPRSGNEPSPRATPPQTSTDIAGVTAEERIAGVPVVGDLPTLGAPYRTKSRSESEVSPATGLPVKPLERDALSDNSDAAVNFAFDSNNRIQYGAASVETGPSSSMASTLSGARAEGGTAPDQTKSEDAFSVPAQSAGTTLQTRQYRGRAIAQQPEELQKKQRELVELHFEQTAKALPRPRTPSPEAPVPQPEVQTSTNAFSTFSLNVSDVSFKLAAASLEKGQMPDVATVRSEEFLNAFDYHDPAPASGQPLAFAWERARDPFAHNRDLLRFSVETAARGREPGRPLNLVLLLDNSGSMERADRVRIIRECLNVLAGQLTAQDRISVVTFARTARLWMDGVPGVQAAASLAAAGQLTPEGGTNLEEAMKLAYATAQRHYLANGVNRVVLLTDGAANLGNVDPESLQIRVETERRQGIALDCFGIGWEGYNDDLLEVLSRHGDGRYGFVNTPQEAASRFASQLAGALQVAASDVKVQVEFNPQRVIAYRQIGYAKHQLTKEQFRDNTVDAAEIGAAESGNALYVIESNPQGQGPIAIVRARFKVPATGEYEEYAWTVPYAGEAVELEKASAAMRLAAAASAFSEWLVASPYAGDVTPDGLLNILQGVPEVFGADRRPTQLEWMIREAQRISGQ